MLPEPHLSVDRTEFVAALRTLKRVLSPREIAIATLSFEPDSLVIQVGGAAASAKANGTWVGEAGAPGGFIAALAANPPLSDPVIVRVAKGRLHVETASVRCEWRSRPEPILRLPIGATTLDLLAVASGHSTSEIEASGLGERIADAEAMRERRVAAAAEQLAPFGVRREDVARLVDERVRARRIPSKGGE